MIDRNVCKLRRVVMWFILFLSIGFVTCDPYLRNNEEVGSHYELNKVNKGVWLRHKHKVEGRQDSGHFFRSISNENEPFSNAVSVINRDKRSAPSKGTKRHVKNSKGLTKEDSNNSLFKNFPLGVAMLLENPNKNTKYDRYSKYETKTPINVENETNDITQVISKAYEKSSLNESESLNFIKDILNATEGNTTAKRSMKYDELVVDRIDLLDMYNKTKDFNKETNVNGDQMWQTAPVPDNNLYEILPKDTNVEKETPKPVTEKGLVKVLSMLTKTFRKIMKQHNSIKLIHEQMSNVNKEFSNKIELNSKKLSDFDVKYTAIMKLVEKLSGFQDCLKKKEEIFKKKEEVMTKNMLDFESQQNKFLAQQQQFYNIQKMMLVQNEKINEKQNSIAKMQNEISHRQNHFAKILKKAKQTIQSNKNLKLNIGLTKIHKENNITTKPDKVTTDKSASIEPVKINLFSMHSNNIIENQDQMILKEKDDKSVDDLIYKYYFNNTFIDSVIRNKILGGVLLGDKTSITRSAKLAAKRNQQKHAKNDTKLKTTLMLPVTMKSLKRERRWINHHSTRKHRKLHPSKGHPIEAQALRQSIFKSPSTTEPPKIIVKESDVVAKDPFLAMATKFCQQIGQSNTKQILDWCVEKSLRRLRSLDRKMMPAPGILAPPPPSETVNPSTTAYKTTLITTVSAPAITTKSPALFHDIKDSALRTGLNGNQFFPDNQELETNLKQFDLTPDTAGNVYFEGSLHASDMFPDKSEGLSDVLPGYDSDSKIDIDPRLVSLHFRKKYLRQQITKTARKH